MSEVPIVKAEKKWLTPVPTWFSYNIRQFGKIDKLCPDRRKEFHHWRP